MGEWVRRGAVAAEGRWQHAWAPPACLLSAAAAAVNSRCPAAPPSLSRHIIANHQPAASPACRPCPLLPLQARHERVDTESALAALKRSAQADTVDLDAQDEEAVK